jgi:hypothetical protein
LEISFKEKNKGTANKASIGQLKQPDTNYFIKPYYWIFWLDTTNAFTTDY